MAYANFKEQENKKVNWIELGFIQDTECIAPLYYHPKLELSFGEMNDHLMIYSGEGPEYLINSIVPATHENVVNILKAFHVYA